MISHETLAMTFLRIFFFFFCFSCSAHRVCKALANTCGRMCFIFCLHFYEILCNRKNGSGDIRCDGEQLDPMQIDWQIVKDGKKMFYLSSQMTLQKLV